eukprot:TRINITY_DN32484_c0_g1_i1.p1 TRINITY_DN32484_c0_g1~~TRINITY_DN32484_c0_g1_i1.p1  ORF type:complete len:165 (+),score=27.18 TRINITY_DN32484_c0_g1_i1:50-544(+)
MGCLGACFDAIAFLAAFGWCLACCGAVFGYCAAPMRRGEPPRLSAAGLFVLSFVQSAWWCRDICKYGSGLCCGGRAASKDAATAPVMLPAYASLAGNCVALVFFQLGAGALGLCVHKQDADGGCSGDVHCVAASAAVSLFWTLFLASKPRHSAGEAASAAGKRD